ncbi:hypothetical protein AAH678_02930 [Sodalis endosymbiont of Spalangia cameroni]|uniref:hypothetical protein n=1 Tax=Sodalis praecaptivus TaxID=1239307 RepID=UPI0031F7FA05
MQTGTLFRHCYEIDIGEGGGRGKHFTSEQATPLQIEFEIVKNADEEPNRHVLRLFNLSSETADAISIMDSVVRLSAGYVEHTGAMLAAVGVITSAITTVQDGGTVTEIEFLDGYQEMRDAALSVAYPKGTKADAALRDIAQKMNLKLVMADRLPFREFPHGYSYYGAARVALRKICGDSGLEWSIQNGELQVIKLNGYTPRRAVVLSASSGMIGSPTRTRIAAKEKAMTEPKSAAKGKGTQAETDARKRQEAERRKQARQEKFLKKQKKDGWVVESLLLPQVNPGDIVKVEARKITTFMRVDAVRHSGSFYGDEWKTELNLREIVLDERDNKQQGATRR